MRWTGYLERVEEVEKSLRSWSENREETGSKIYV
jgi:hypothetical protein